MNSLKSVSQKLSRGRIGVIPTDTIYGLVCSALNPDSVERLYRIRKRDTSKPCIILISGIDDLGKFNIKTTKELVHALDRVWPGAVSVILDCHDEQFAHLHKGTKTLAFRVPGNDELRDLLKKTGPLLAPSANPEGKSPATSAAEAKKYFGKEVDFYIDGGELVGQASTLVKYEDGKFITLRDGLVKVEA